MVMVVIMAATSAWRPDIGLLILAALLPVVTWALRGWHGAVAWPEVLAVAFAAGYSARQASVRHRHPPHELTTPISVAVLVVMGSLGVRLLFLHGTIGGEALRAYLWNVVSRNYFVGTGGFLELDAAMRLIEGLILVNAAAAAARARPTFAGGLVRTVVVGAAAASVINLWRVWLGALRLDSPVTTFLHYLATLRYNVHYPDVNAAGSYFVMALFPALALTVRTRGGGWLVATVLIGLSFALAGSRAAVVAGIFSALALGARGLGRFVIAHARGRLAVALVVSAVVLAVSAAAYATLRRARTTSQSAMWIRVEFVQTSLRMLASRPAFGIGIGEYPQQSGTFSSPQLLKLYPPAEHENAHNNFLQVLAELGLIGFGAFIWILATAAVGCARRLAHHHDGSLHWTVCAGLLAFVTTWLAGHPLLIDAPALSFWLLLGTAAGWNAPTGPDVGRPPGGRWWVAVLALALVISVPVRARSALANADLEHRGIGLSLWQHGDDGVRYRLAGDTSAVFVPSTARVVTIPLRGRGTTDELEVELRLDGRLADIVRVDAAHWLMLQLQLPDAADAPRFRRLDLRVRTAPGAAAPVLAVGKVTPR
jgi:O-antigen ligase